MEILNQARVQNAKFGFSTRRVPTQSIKTLISSNVKPSVGDLVLARVTSIGSHQRIELPTGRKAMLHIGDEIVLAYGNRYAPDQYEAYVPTCLSPCHMVAAGGVAGQAKSWHNRLSGPTQIEPLGLLGNSDGEVINLSDHTIENGRGIIPHHVFAVFGTSMNAGKTTTAASLVKGFSQAGYRTGVAKVTGTGAGGDLWLMRDYGAVEALDFTDAGYPTTFGISPERLVESSRHLLCALGEKRCSVAVLEIADGLYQEETAWIAASDRFKSFLNGTFFAAGDAMGGVHGANTLTGLGHNVMAVSGVLTRSPLAMREVGAGVSAPVMLASDLSDPRVVEKWVGLQGLRVASGE